MEYGLYLTIKENNRMERHMMSPKGEELMWESTIQDEIIAFSELGFLPYAELLTVMEIYGEAVHCGEGLPIEEVNLEYLNELFLITNDLISELCKEDPLHGFLTWTHLEDVIPKDDGSAIWGIHARNALLDGLAEILHFQGKLIGVLHELAETGSTNLTALGPVNAQQLYMNGREVFFFRSASDYYHFLLLETVKRDIRVARCQCCGRFFIPKTKKRTLYCDRVLKDEKTCKQWGPILKHKREAGNDTVIEEFDRARQKMYKRYERTRDSKRPKTEKALSAAQLWQWIDRATQARDQYLLGGITEEEALAVIRGVPEQDRRMV